MPAIRHEYERQGVTQYYAAHGASYRNPHEALVGIAVTTMVQNHALDLTTLLDLAAGSGEVTLALLPLLPAGANPAAIDPYTGDAFILRTQRPCEAISFEQIAAGALFGRNYSLIVCSFALHLAAPSRMPAIAHELRQVASSLLILTPHQKPFLRESWGWKLTAEERFTSGPPDHLRCRARLYRGT